MPPRRCLDYTEFKINSVDKNNDNFMDKNNLVFNTCKSSTQKGQQKLKIPKKLKSILTKYIKIVDDKSDYLLIDG